MHARVQIPLIRIAAFVWPACVAGAARADVLDACDATENWIVAPSDGVDAQLRTVERDGGRALRLDFNFRRGAGFCVVRRAVDLELPENYVFSFELRGEARPNNLEFKLVDPSGENVWWVNRRAFEFPTDWRTIRYRARHFQFAWGPSGGKRLERIGAIEFAIASAEGGSGYVCFDELRFEPRPPAAAPGPARLRIVQGESASPEVECADLDALPWTGGAATAVTIAFAAPREFGGLALRWDEEHALRDYEIELTDGAGQRTVVPCAGGGARDYLRLPDVEAAAIHIRPARGDRDRRFILRGLRLLPPECDNWNVLGRVLAAETPRGIYPRYFVNEAPAWTVVGVAGADDEALFDSEGALELSKGGYRIEPFVRSGERFLSWADGETRCTLAEAYLPLPAVTREADDWRLEIAPVAVGEGAQAELLVRYRLRNLAENSRDATLCLAVRPFQVLPPWQELNIIGGVARHQALQLEPRCVRLDGRIALAVAPEADKADGPAPAADGVQTLSPALPGADTGSRLAGPPELASGVLRYTWRLEAGESRCVYVGAWAAATSIEERNAERRFEAAVETARRFWRDELNRVRLELPPSGALLANTFRSTQAYILLNADGPAIQPGSRSYERSWIRDGSLTSTALLYTGHPARVRAFAAWYAPHQFESGKVPCVVDRRGPDPVPEHDSHGQLIYLLHKYYRFTRQRAFLEQLLPHVVAAVDYIERIRNERLTDEYREGAPEKRACYGLVPESISHEGYSAKPMHSYWDDFFVLRGLRDATRIAEILGRDDLAARFGELRDSFAETLGASIRLAMQNAKIDYLPGCAELGDFDATSTAIALYPCDVTDVLPEEAVRRTFDKYWEFFCDRRDGKSQWEAYTPYELRLVGTFVRLGQPERAHALLDWFFAHQRPPGWNQWAEVVWNPLDTPKFIGDMPHTWVGSDFLSAARSLFVYERERDQAVVLGAALKPEWLRSEAGVKVEDFPTEYGSVSYAARGHKGEFRLEYRCEGEVPPGGFVVSLPAASGRVTVDNVVVEGGAEVRVRAARADIVAEQAGEPARARE